ncbi:acid protease [Panus rudis PR-1116 ss-1]|nr:acid protease [Panus rudis PR-1116 ss-1]
MFKSIIPVLLGIGLVHGVWIPFIRRDGKIPSVSVSRNLTNGDPYVFQNVNNSLYAGVIYVSGEPFFVQIDTGSSDLWLDTAGRTLSNITNTGVYSNLTYGDLTSAEGNITLADVTWGKFTVKNQAWINAPNADANANGSIQGLIGVGPPTLAELPKSFSKANASYDGKNFLDHVFSLNPEEPNYITFHLTRGNDTGITDGGEFTIGEVVQNYSSITSTPKLPVISDKAWVTWTDAIVHNGKRITNTTASNSTLKHPWISYLDSGTTLTTAPRPIIDEIFGSIPGAKWREDDRLYTVPCDTKVNISIVFGGNEFPIHPIDAVGIRPVSPQDSQDGYLCFGAIQEVNSGAIDFILGDTFLRNVYTLYDFGRWATVGKNDPYMQVLKLTDADQAWAEFDALNAARITNAKQEAASLYGNSTQPSSSSSQSSTSSLPAPASVSGGASSSTSPSPITTSAGGVTTSFVATTVVVTTSVSPVSSSVPTAVNSDAKDLTAAGALGDDDEASKFDTSTLERNAYIIMGLLGGVIVLLMVLIVAVIAKARGSKDQTYSQASYKEIKPLTLSGDHYSAEYSTPYADGGH